MDTINWDELAQKISDYLRLLEWGAYASLLAVLVTVINLILLCVLIKKMNKLARQPATK